MIRATTPADSPALVALAESTGVFKPEEIEALREVFDEYYNQYQVQGHRCIVYEADGRRLGFAYYTATSMTDRTGYLWWIAVDKRTQARGTGSKMLRSVEDDIQREKGRLVIIETSSRPHYELTRRFYLKHGYEQAAVIADYYSDGDDLVVICKRLLAEPGTHRGGGPQRDVALEALVHAIPHNEPNQGIDSGPHQVRAVRPTTPCLRWPRTRRRFGWQGRCRLV
jgi:ribosomal protein S18 acetylase RimI-like enzyme